MRNRMRRVLALVVGLIGGAWVLAVPVQAATFTVSGTASAGLSDGLAAYYPFNGNANDESGNGHHGTAFGASLTTDRFGNADSAYNFDGVDDAVFIPNSTNLNFGSSPFSGTLWMKAASLRPAWNVLAEKDIGGVGNPSWFVVVNQDGTVRFVVADGRGIDFTVISTSTVSDGNFHFIAWVRKPEILEVYVDGQLSGTLAATTGSVSNNETLVIGAAESWGSLDAPFNGIIDEVALYNKALSLADIQALYHLGSPPQPPVAIDDTYFVDEDAALTVSAPGVLVNDTDPDGDPLTAVLVSGPSNGLLNFNADGSFTYTPTVNFSGSDTFIYKANDGSSDSNLAVVTITVRQVNDAPVASADGPYLGVTGIPVTVDASSSSDVEGASLTFQWDFGDGSTLVTTQPSITHTYATPGIFTVTLVANDGQLNSVPFTTQATIGNPGSGGRDDVDAFLSYVNPTQARTDLPVGTTGVNVTIIYGSTIIPGSFQAVLNGTPFFGFTPKPGASETVTISLSHGRNVLSLNVDGVRSDGRTATDRDRLTFIVP